MDRMNSVNTRVVLVDGDGKGQKGFDSFEELKKVPKGFKGYIWTNKITKVEK